MRRSDSYPVILFYLLLLLGLLLPSSPGLASPPILPEVSGFDPDTPAGSGGQILRVTRLADSGPGSLRAALATVGPRIVLFEVGGEINLQTDLEISQPFLTLAGQTAPSPGITIRGAGLRIYTHDILIQHLRIRVGDAEKGPKPINRDAIQVLGPEARKIIIDHISASWSIDEIFSTWFPVDQVTLSHSILSEALNQSSHPKGPHSAGLLIGPDSLRVTIVGNLLVHNSERNPRLHGATSVRFINNLIYNGQSQMVIGSSSGPSLADVIGNRFLAGPQTPADQFAVIVLGDTPIGNRIFLLDNLSELPLFRWQTPAPPRAETSPFPSAPIDHRPSRTLEPWVLATAGARPGDRDAVDQRIVSEVRQRSGRIIDRQTEVGGWPEVKATHRPLLSFNPHQDSDADGLSNIEEYLQWAARQVEKQKVLQPILSSGRYGRE